jgi:hypothetical protein
MPLRNALIEAGRVRLRPILMTTVALIAGMIPVAMGLGEGADFRAPPRPRGDRRHHHLDVADFAGDPDDLRDLVETREKVLGWFGRGKKAGRPAKPEPIKVP